ncbi:MAG: hypothetical protein ABR926_01400 [Streptosporangiaceae bacterium]
MPAASVVAPPLAPSVLPGACTVAWAGQPRAAWRADQASARIARRS